MRIGRQSSSPKKPTRPPVRSLPGTTTMPRQDPCRGPGKTLAKSAPIKLPPPFTCSCQPNQLGGHLRGNMQLPSQLIERLCGGMQIFVKAPPPCHLSCLAAYMAPRTSLARARVKARRSGDGRDGPRPIPNKARGHLSYTLNASCLVIRAISSEHCTPFHLLCATVAAPFDYKRRPMAYWRGSRLF